MKKTSYLAQLTVLCVLAYSSASLYADNTAYTHFNINLNRLNAVACDYTGNQCIAVGYGTGQHLQDRLAYLSEDGGKTWNSPIRLAAPKEETNPVLSDDPNPISISCNISGQDCKIVSSAIIDKIPTPIVYSSQDGGLTWSKPKLLPLPKSVNEKQKYNNNSIYTSISCDQTGEDCTIAGGIAGDQEALPLLYSTKDAGKNWQLYKSLKNPSYQAPSDLFHGTLLNGISCNFSGQHCIAVGYSVIAASFFSNHYSAKPVLYYTQDAGSHWSKPIVLPMDNASTNTVSTLTDIACDSSGMQCTTIGYSYDYTANLSHAFSFSTRNGGLDWADKIFITPTTDYYRLESMHCDNSGTRCKAAGWSSKNVTRIPVFVSLIYSTNDAGKTWKKDTLSPLPHSSILTDIFCNISSEYCIAVGTQAQTNNTTFLAKSDKIKLQPNLHQPQQATRA